MKPDRGIRAGSCWNEHCQRPGAFYVDLSTHKYYCSKCADKLNKQYAKEAATTAEAVAAWDHLHMQMRKLGMESDTIDTIADYFASINDG